MESFSVPKPESGPTPKDLVLGALEQLKGDAAPALDAVQSLTATQEEFIAAIAAFNDLPAETRGKDRYDHSRPLTENVDRELTATSPKGYPYTAVLHKNGEVTLSTPLT